MSSIETEEQVVIRALVSYPGQNRNLHHDPELAWIDVTGDAFTEDGVLDHASLLGQALRSTDLPASDICLYAFPSIGDMPVSTGASQRITPIYLVGDIVDPEEENTKLRPTVNFMTALYGVLRRHGGSLSIDAIDNMEISQVAQLVQETKLALTDDQIGKVVGKRVKMADLSAAESEKYCVAVIRDRGNRYRAVKPSYGVISPSGMIHLEPSLERPSIAPDLAVAYRNAREMGRWMKARHQGRRPVPA